MVEVEVPLVAPDRPADVDHVVVGLGAAADAIGEDVGALGVGGAVVPDDADRVGVADLLDAERARAVVAAERGVGAGLVDGAALLAEPDVGDRLAVLEDDVAVGARERAVVVEA